MHARGKANEEWGRRGGGEWYEINEMGIEKKSDGGVGWGLTCFN